MSAPIRFSKLASRFAFDVLGGIRPIGMRPLALLTAVLLAALLIVVPAGNVARADALDDARAQGLVGERYDGFLAIHDINAKRRKLYSDVAARQGASVDAVGRIYAGQIIQKVPAGTWILQQNGNWVRK